MTLHADSQKAQPASSRRRIFWLCGILVVIVGVYFSLPKSWFEIPPDKPLRPTAVPNVPTAPAPGPATLDSLRDATEKAPLDYVAHSRYGMALASAGRAKEALEQLQTAARLSPDSPIVYHNLGVFFLNTGQPDRADTAFLRELEYVPGDGRAHYYRGLALQARRRYPEAAAQLELATRLAPDMPESYLALAVQLTEKRPLDVIKGYVDNYLRLDGPNKGLAYHALSRAYRKQQQYDDAIRYAELATKTDPNVYPFWRNLGQIYSYAHRETDADKALHRAAELTRNASPVYIELGMNAQKAGHFDQAVQAFQKALELSPETGNIHLYIARAYQRLGDNASADKEEKAFRQWQRAHVPH